MSRPVVHGIAAFAVTGILLLLPAAAQEKQRCYLINGQLYCEPPPDTRVHEQSMSSRAYRRAPQTITRPSPPGPSGPTISAPSAPSAPPAPPPVAAPSPPPPTYAPPARNGGPRTLARKSAPRDTLLSSGIFAGPHDIPPQEFAAYGIVAFPERSTSYSRARHLMVCEAFVATLPTPSELSVPTNEQMVTVWPVRDIGIATELSVAVGTTDRLRGCERAVEHYHLPTALTALRQARIPPGGQGPYLLAWSPAAHKGRPDVLVLVVDLSNAVTAEALHERFRKWRDDIEQNPELFRDRWTFDRLRLALREWADHWGGIIITTGGK
jgi:hypothetical protein